MNLTLSESDIPAGALERALSEAVKEQVADLQLFTAREAAALLKLPLPTFRDLVKREQVGSVDLGPRGARWTLKQIQELIKRREVKAAPLSTDSQ
jgi:hypothetical protein